jgi:hypothetical protein
LPNLSTETIALIITIIGAAGYIIELNAKVDHIENQLENHPLLAAYREIQDKQAITAVE